MRDNRMTHSFETTEDESMQSPNRGRIRRVMIALAGCAMLLAGATTPNCGEMTGPEFVYMTELDLRVTGPGGGSTEDVTSEMVESVDRAERRVLAALGDDVMTSQLTQALIRAKNGGGDTDDGIDVHIIADSEDRSTDPFQQLEDAGFSSNLAGNCTVPDCDITYGDGQLEYLPNPNLTPVLSGCDRQDAAQRVLCTANSSTQLCGGVGTEAGAMCRPDDFNSMSHRFLIVDTETVWNISGDGSGAGMLAWRGKGEWLMESFRREFRQIRGGTFSTTLDEYNGPLKSVTDPEVHFNTDQGVMELRYNPQERLMKHVVDKVYGARSSVTIVTPKLTNPFLVDALEYKQDNGFDVRVVISEEAQPQRSINADLADLNVRTVSGGASLPTLLTVDYELDADFPDRNGDAKQWPRHAMVLSHAMIRARPFEVLPPQDPDAEDASDRVRVYPADLFNDGNMWHLYEFNSTADEWDQLNQFDDFGDAVWSNGTPYQP